MFLSLIGLTQLLKMGFDLTLQHPDSAANMPQGRQLATFRLPPHRPLANPENLFQFREPD
jgi:hypothetical protein